MKKKFMRKYFDDIADESLDQLTSLMFRWKLIDVLFRGFWAYLYVFLLVPVIILYACEKEITTSTNIVMWTYIVIASICYIVFLKFFRLEKISFSRFIALRIYFILCTQKGKAMTMEDFDIIKEKHEELYYTITEQECRGCCYPVCFEICKTLRKGAIEFIAIKQYRYKEGTENFKDKSLAGYEYTLHMLYVNNGWAFDPYSVRQYPVDELRKIFQGKTCRTFKFEEIEKMSYDEFRENSAEGIKTWCEANECYVKFGLTE